MLNRHKYFSAIIFAITLFTAQGVFSQIPSTLDSLTVLPLDSATATSFRVQLTIQPRKFQPQSSQLWLSFCIGYDIALDSTFQQIVQTRNAIRQPIGCVCMLQNGCGVGDCSPKVTDSIIQYSFIVSRLLPATRYYFRANYWGKLNDYSIISLYSRMQTITLPLTPQSSLTPPILQQNNDILDKSFRMKWDSASGAPTQYLVDVSRDSTFRTTLPSYTNAVVKDTQLIVTNLLPGTRYFYRIRSSDNQRVSPYSRIGQEVTLPSPNLQARQLAIFRPTLLNISGRIDSTFYHYFLSQNLTISQIDSVLNVLLLNGIPIEKAYSQANQNCRGVTNPSEIIVKLRSPSSRIETFGFNRSSWIWTNDCDCPYLRQYSNFIVTGINNQTADISNIVKIFPSPATDKFMVQISLESTSIMRLS